MKFGSFSLVLNKDEYSNIGFEFNDYDNIMLKITQKTDTLGEINYLDFLSKKNDYVVEMYKYTKIDINLDDKLIEYLSNCIREQDIYNIFQLKLSEEKFVGYFMENLGNIDIFDSLTQLLNNEPNIWDVDTDNRLTLFGLQMCNALKYLKQNSIAHLDIKVENIIYNNNTISMPFEKRFKLIDFGFSDTYPFNNYKNKLYGSPFYSPYCSQTEYPEWSLKLNPNDWTYNKQHKKFVHYVVINNADSNLIYKTDIYSMGIVFHQILYYINKYSNKNTGNHLLSSIIKHMTDININSRYDCDECIDFLEDDKDNKYNCCIKLI